MLSAGLAVAAPMPTSHSTSGGSHDAAPAILDEEVRWDVINQRLAVLQEAQLTQTPDEQQKSQEKMLALQSLPQRLRELHMTQDDRPEVQDQIWSDGKIAPEEKRKEEKEEQEEQDASQSQEQPLMAQDSQSSGQTADHDADAAKYPVAANVADVSDVTAIEPTKPALDPRGEIYKRPDQRLELAAHLSHDNLHHDHSYSN